MQTGSPEEISQLLANPPKTGLQLLDVREPWEYDIVHIEGAVLIPLGELGQNMDKLQGNIPVAVLCHHGICSAHACYQLEKAGFETINIRGGIDLWARALDPAMALY